MPLDLVQVTRDRALAAGSPWTDDDPAPHAIVGAAFACLRAATLTSTETAPDLRSTLDRAMSAVAPLE